VSSTQPLTRTATRPRWHEIDLVLLDMDGTLLDLRFDNYFWQRLVPERYALRHGMTHEQAQAHLSPKFSAKQGTLDWYCVEYWSRELDLDIAELKREIREQIRFLPGAEAFLAALRERALRTVLVTNAHHESLAIKAGQTDLMRYFDQVISSHRFGRPKEDLLFWEKLQAELGFERSRTLFVDDSLPVLRAARAFGIGQVFAISHPDSEQEGRIVREFPAVRSVQELLPPR